MSKTESNEIIARVLGVVYIDDEGLYYSSDGYWLGPVLEYHSSWQALIPAIEKVKCRVKDEMEMPMYFWEDNEDAVQDIEDAVWTDDIDSAYNALIGLINKYSIS
jgi:hypothetical protein